MRHEPEPTRTRQHGTSVTHSTTPGEKIAAIRRIVNDRQYAKIDGTTIDLFTASAILAVFDALNETNQVAFLAMPIPKMAAVAFKLLK